MSQTLNNYSLVKNERYYIDINYILHHTCFNYYKEKERSFEQAKITSLKLVEIDQINGSASGEKLEVLIFLKVWNYFFLNYIRSDMPVVQIQFYRMSCINVSFLI